MFILFYSNKIDKFYIGFTSNLNHRSEQHNSGASKFTKNKEPWCLAYFETFDNKNLALKREKEMKNWKSKKRIIETFKLKKPYCINYDL